MSYHSPWKSYRMLKVTEKADSQSLAVAAGTMPLLDTPMDAMTLRGKNPEKSRERMPTGRGTLEKDDMETNEGLFILYP